MPFVVIFTARTVVSYPRAKIVAEKAKLWLEVRGIVAAAAEGMPKMLNRDLTSECPFDADTER